MILNNDELWELIKRLLPPPKTRRFRYPGRRPLSDRQVLEGILFVLRTGIRWAVLPQELGYGSGMSCWRRLDTWQRSSVWDRLHEMLLARLRNADDLLDQLLCGFIHLRRMSPGVTGEPHKTAGPALRQPLASGQHHTDGLALVLRG